MFKLIKWVGIGAVAVAVTGYVVFGSHVTSYLGTAASSIREGITGQIPVEFELKRAERLIGEIDPELFNARREVAQAEVDLDNLETEIVKLGEKVEHGERKLRHVSAGLSGSGAEYELASYVRVRVEMDLERTFDSFRNNVALLNGKRAQVERQTHAVVAARTHLDAVLGEKARLEEMVAALKTQKKQIDALAATSTGIELDDTALGQAREVLEEVKNRLDVAQRMLEDDIYLAGERMEQGRAHRDITKEIGEYFSVGADDRGAKIGTAETVYKIR